MTESVGWRYQLRCAHVRRRSKGRPITAGATTISLQTLPIPLPGILMNVFTCKKQRTTPVVQRYALYVCRVAYVRPTLFW